jgi:hypothetical protein
MEMLSAATARLAHGFWAWATEVLPAQYGSRCGARSYPPPAPAATGTELGGKPPGATSRFLNPLYFFFAWTFAATFRRSPFRRMKPVASSWL